MDLRKGTITEDGKKINWWQTATGISYANGKTAIPSPANMDAKIAYKTAQLPVVEQPKPEVPVPTVGIDHVYLAVKALNSSGVQALNGDRVLTIPDQVGKYPLKYVGTTTPLLTGAIFQDGEVNFDNEPHVLFNTDRFDKIVNYPYEQTLVLRVVPGTGYEQFENDWNNNLSLGDSGGLLRAGDADVNTQTFPGSKYEYFKVIVIHILAEAGKQTMWLNGKNLGSIPSRTDSRKWLNSVGVDTNNAQWNFIAKYVKLSRFTDTERTAHLDSVMKQFVPGSLPAAPYASDVAIEKGAVYTARYKYNGSRPQDMSRTQFRWLGMDGSGLGGVKVIGLGEILPLASVSLFSAIRVEVKVFDTDGRSFRYVSMPFQKK